MSMVDKNIADLQAADYKSMKEGMRGLLFEVYKGTDFLEVAQQGGYDKAEGMLAKTKALTEEGKEAIKGIKPTERDKPYTRPQHQSKRRPFVPFNQMMMHPGPSSMQQGVSHMQQPYPNNYHQPFPNTNYYQPYPNNNFVGQGMQMGMHFPVQTRPRGPGPDKSKSTCKACLKTGHWAGDFACPLNGFQPPPPGL